MKLRTKILAAMLGGLLATAAAAQSWPTRPVRIFLGFPTGISVDLVTRVVAAEMGKQLGANFIVENRPGAGGVIALSAAARAEPDGYTVAYSNGLVSELPAFRKEPIVMGKDLAPLGDIAQASFVAIVRGSLGIKTFQDLVAYSKANPGKLNYGNTAPIVYLLTEYVKAKTGLSYTPIPYPGAPIKEMLSGEVDFYTGSLGAAIPYIADGRMVPVLSFSKESRFPNVPTVVDLGIMPSPIRTTQGFFAPMGTPREIVQRFSGALQAASKSTELIEGLRKLGYEVYYTTPEQQMAEYKANSALFAEAGRIANYVPQ